MVQLLYDNTFEGLLSAIFDIYSMKITEVNISNSKNFTPSIFDPKIEVIFNEEKYNRVHKKLQDIIGNSGLNTLWRAYLSELKTVENTIFNVVKYAIDNPNKAVLSNFANDDVVELHQILKQVGREKHRMDAFVRFELGEDDIYYATIEPDFNVLPLNAKHFQRRYADQKWIIYDVKRDYGIYYDLHKTIRVELVSGNNLPVESISIVNEEGQYQKLWKAYFKSTNIVARKNMKLHLQHVPKRYWKYLTEKK